MINKQFKKLQSLLKFINNGNPLQQSTLLIKVPNDCI